MYYTPVSFPSKGFIQFELTDEELLPIQSEIQNIIDNNFDYEVAYYKLAGHIKKEFALENCKKHIEDLMISLITKYTESFGENLFIDDILSRNVNLFLDQVWVNFQVKYEFNPIHLHSGIYSFVIWIKLPYDKEDESKYFKNNFSNEKDDFLKSGKFDFIYSNIFGMPETYSIFTDKSMEGKGVFFPSILNHCVYPFFSSDEYRISISGNIKYKV